MREAHRERNWVDNHVKLEDEEEKGLKVVKDFHEEVPEESNVWEHVWHCCDKDVDVCDKVKASEGEA